MSRRDALRPDHEGALAAEHRMALALSANAGLEGRELHEAQADALLAAALVITRRPCGTAAGRTRRLGLGIDPSRCPIAAHQASGPLGRPR